MKSSITTTSPMSMLSAESAELPDVMRTRPICSPAVKRTQRDAGHGRAGLQASLYQLALERRAMLAPATSGLCVLLGHGVHQEPGAHHPRHARSRDPARVGGASPEGVEAALTNGPVTC